MLQKLGKIGALVPNGMFPENLLGLNLDYETEEIVFINFEYKDDTWIYEGTTVEEFSKSKADKYLVKTKKGNYTPDFPSFPVYNFEDLTVEEEINFKKSKVGKRLIRCLKKYEKKFEGIINELLANQKVKNDLKFKAKDFNDFLLSFKFDGEYVGESKWVSNKIESLKGQGGNKDYYTFKKKKYEANNKLCSITGKKKDTIWGYASPYKFYAVKTDLSRIAGGFDATKAWKNFPVSPEGARYLERGQKFVEEHLDFKFCGIKYFLIPERLLSNGEGNEFIEYIQDFKKFCLNKQEGTNNQLEEDLIDLLAEKENSASYTLFFYKPQNREFKILASVEDVFPSYATKIFEARESAEDHAIFKGLKVNNEIIDLKFSFSHIKEFVPETKAFLDVVRSIFMQKKVDYDYLLNRIMNSLQVKFANKKYMKLALLKAVLILKLLHKLNLIDQTKTTDKLVMDNKYEAFFNNHAAFFINDSATKKAIFLEGVLVQKLLNIQYQDRGSKPFRSRLHSLKLKEKYIKNLLTEAIEKLEQYDKNYYRDLEKTISKYLLDSKFEISNDEISFYFTMGMNLAGEFKTDKNKVD